jgi:autotransporter-associated beta strand protein
MNRLPKTLGILCLTLITVCNFQKAFGTDGSWTQTAAGNQDWTVIGNWLNGFVPSGIDSSAIINVNLTADQSIVNVGGQTVGHLFFQDTDTSTAGGYNFGLATDVGSITLDVSSGRSIIDVGNLNTGGKKVSLIDPIINADGILKLGAGQFSIRANSPGITSDYIATAGLTDTRSFLNGLANLQVVGGGQFQVDFVNASAANISNLLNPACPVILGGTVLVPSPVIPPFTLPLTPNTPVNGGGTLTISGRNTSVNTQMVAGVTFNRGSHTINLTTGTGAGAIAVFDPTTFTRNAGAVVNFNTAGTTTNVMMARGLVNDANGIIGGWAIDGANWATVSGSALAPLTTYQTSTDPSTWTSGQNVSLAGNPIAAIGTRTINTLRVTASSTNSIGSGNVLTLSDGGLLGTAGVVQFNDGTIQGPAGGELIIYQTAGTNLMNSVIADNTSTSTLIKSGGGVLMLAGTNANTYTGGTFVNQGALQIGDGFGGGNSSSLGTGPVTLFGSLQILKTNDLTIANSISGSGLLIKQGAGTLTLSGVNTYNGYNLSAPGSTVSGANGSLGLAGTRLDAGAIAIANDTALGGVFRFQNANTTLRSADSSTRTVTNNIDDASSPVTVGAPGTGDLIFTGVVDTGNGAKAFNISNNITRFNGVLAQGTAPGANTFTKGGPGKLVLGNTANTITKPIIITGGTVQIGDEACLGPNPPGAVAAQLNLNGGALETTTTMTIDDFNRGITVGTAGGTFLVDPGTTLTISANNPIAGTGGSLTKAGAGTLVLSSFESYSGSTLVNGGTLKLDTSGSIPLSGSITVGNGATFDVSAVSGFALAPAQTLGGSGTVVGNVTGSGSSIISPGNSPGTLTFNNDLNLATGDTLVFDLTNNTTIGSGVNDLLVVNGALNLNNNSVTIRPLAVGGALANGTYRLVNYSGPKTGTLTVNSGTRFSLAIDDSTPNQINLQVTGLPATLVWKGNNGNSWDISTTTNWLNGANPDVFFNFDTVTFNDTASTFNVSLNATVLPNTMTVNANTDYVFTGSGGISGVASVTKSGSGKLLLDNFGINDYSGATTINSGTLQIGQNDGAGSIGSGPIINNGTLRFQNASSLNVSNLSGSGTLLAEGTQDLILTTGNSYSGPTIVSTNARIGVYATFGSTLASLGNTPTVTVLSDGALYTTVGGVYTQALVLNGDGFSFETTGSLRAGNVNVTWLGPITFASDAALGNDGSTLIISNSIAAGGFNLTKVGAGTLVLAAANTYGTTTIQEGPLQLGNGSTTGTLGSGPIIDNWYLAVNRSDDLTISAPISGVGGLLKSGANTLTLTGNNTIDGTFNGSSPLGTGAPGATGIRIDAGTLAVGSDTALGTGIVRNNTAGVVLRAADAATRTISNTIDLANDFVLGSATTGNLIFNGTINSGNAAKTLTISNNLTTINGVVSGGNVNNNITKAGPGALVLNATNTYGKPTLVNAGTLIVNGVIGTNTVTVANGALLSGTGVITGPLTVQAGGTLAPGSSIGTLTVSNTLALAGTNIMEVNKTAATSDLIQGLTNVTYGGVLSVVNLSGTLAAGDSFKLFDSQAYAGAFASITPATPGAGLAWDTTSLAVNGTLKVVSAASPPHFNSPVLSGSTLTLSGGGGTPNGNYILLASTNVALSVANWDRVSTNQFDSNGNFSISTTVTPAAPQRFFLIQLP